MSAIGRDPITFKKLTDPWKDNCSPACHTMNKSTWDELASRSDDRTFQCPISRTVLTVDCLRKNRLVADLIKKEESDKKNKRIMRSSDPAEELLRQLVIMKAIRLIVSSL